MFMHAWQRKFSTPALFAGMHALFSVYRLLPVLDGASALTFLIPSGELLIIFALCACREHGGEMPAVWLRYVMLFTAALVAGVMIFHSVGEIFYRYFYFDHFHPLSDGRLTPGLFEMLVEKTGINSTVVPFLSWGIVAIVLLGSGFLVSHVVRRFAKYGSGKISNYFRWTTLVLGTVLVIAMPDNSALAQTAIDAKNIIAAGRRSGESAGVEAAPGYIDVTMDEAAADYSASLDPAVQPMAFPAIKDADIHIVVVESYGSTLYEREEYLEAMIGLYAELERTLTSDGWVFYSGLVRSPAFGGRSWLADATLLTGEQIKNQNDFENRMLREDPARLPELMTNAGYHRIYAAPGTSKTADAWLDTYPFDDYLLRNDFDYEGPFISFGSMSDQYILDRVRRDHLLEYRKEFVFYLLVSSHVPFETIPEYKPDWDFSLNGREYESGYLRHFDNDWLSGNELAEGYIAGISYTLTAVVHYLTERLSQTEFMLVIGDHQPRKPVSVAGSGYLVPFHLIVPYALRPAVPYSWILTNTLMPPQSPENENNLPPMSEIAILIESIVTASPATR